MTDLAPVSFDLADVDLHRQTRALELPDRRGAYFECEGGAFVVPRKHAAEVADILFPSASAGDVARWA